MLLSPFHATYYGIVWSVVAMYRTLCSNQENADTIFKSYLKLFSQI